MARTTSALAAKLASEWAQPRLDAAAERGKESVTRYARDPFAHCEDGHVWIEDLETGIAVPLHPWPHQEEFTADWIDLDYLARTGRLRFRNVHEEKSRQMGFTWWVAYLITWILRWHAAPGLAVFPVVSDAADSGPTTDSFFGRVKFITEYGLNEGDEGEGWPPHLRPPLSFTGGNSPVIRNDLVPRAFLAAEGSTATPGRGKKYAYAFIDEFAYHQFDRAAHRALARAIPQGRFYNSTPHGEDNTYAWLRRVRPQGYVFRTDHWSQHPLYGQGLHVAASVDQDTKEVVERGDPKCKLCQGVLRGVEWRADDVHAHRYPGKLTSPWYERAIVELTDEDVASELEIDYTASIVARVYPTFSEARHVAAVEIPFAEALPIEMSFDYGADTTSVTVCQDAPSEYRVIGEVEVHDAMPEDVVAAVRAELIDVGVPEWWLDRDWMRSHIFAVGDPAGEPRQLATGRPLVADYRRLGIEIASRVQSVDATIRAVKRLLNGKPKPLVISKRCPLLVEHFKHNRYPVDRQGVRKPGAPPHNDRHNHMMRSLAYLITYKFPPPSVAGAIQDAAAGAKPADWMRDVNRRTGRIDDAIRPDMPL